MALSVLNLALLAGCSNSEQSDAHAHTGGGTGGKAGNGGSSTGGTSSGGTSTGGTSAGGTSTGGTSTGGSAGSAGAAPANKRGVAYGYNSDEDLGALSQGIGWWYNWSPKPDATLVNGYPGLGVEFVPMIWGGQFDPTKLDGEVPAGAKYLLTFNEPNFGNQANLTPDQAAALWPEIEAFASKHGLQIVSPAVNYCGSPCNETDPFVWLQKFFAACSNCKVDFVAMHWYACTKSALTSTLAKYEQQFQKPLWVTEFSCLDDASHVNDTDELAYMKDAVTALEADSMVFRYAWFTGRFSQSPAINLLGANSGELTPLGQEYVNMP